MSTSINITDSISGQAAPKGEEKNPEGKVHVHCPPIESPGCQDRVVLKAYPSRLSGASPSGGEPKRKKSQKSRCSLYFGAALSLCDSLFLKIMD